MLINGCQEGKGTPALVAVYQDATGKALHGWSERFGVRELKVVGRQFYLNGKPYFFRGCGDHNYDQINLIEPADRERFKEHMSIYKEAGFNYARFHTHSPFPEYFEAADEKGMLLQPELPYYHDVPTEPFPFDPKRAIHIGRSAEQIIKSRSVSLRSTPSRVTNGVPSSQVRTTTSRPSIFSASKACSG